MSLHKTRGVSSYEEKVKAVKTYLSTGLSLRKAAFSLNIPYKTLWFWTRLYKEGGEQRLRKQRLPKRKLSKAIETKIMTLKERTPWLTINRARELMKKTGTHISNNGIWGIWKRYGLIKRKNEDPLNLFTNPTPELNQTIVTARALVEKDDYKGAARILNEPPCLPECQLLKRIPEEFLTLRRRFERFALEQDEITYQQALKKAKRLGILLEKNGFIHTSLIANFMELNILSWLGKPEERIAVLKILARKISKCKQSSLRFLFYLHQASTHGCLLQISKALESIKKCRRLIYLLPYPYYLEEFGTLLTFVSKYKNACFFYNKAYESTKDKGAVERLTLRIAFFGHSYAGEYKKCKKMLNKVETLKDSISLSATYSLTRAYISFGQGDLTMASKLFVESLEKAAKGEMHNRIYASSVGLAAVAMALNKKSEAKIYLQKYLSLMKKYRMAYDELRLRYLITLKGNIPKQLLHMPVLRLLDLLLRAKQTMKISDYRKAFDFARSQGITGLFHRWIVFFPEVVLHLLEKGKPTGLPKTILKFPIFNKEAPVYNMKILGTFIVYKNQKYLRVKLKPKDTAFLIQLSLRAGEPDKEIPLERIYVNFWKNSKNPSRNLSHLLVRIKKALQIPSHLLEVSYKKDNPVLINRGIHFITDYDEFQQSLVQAKALLRAGEWGFAKREYLHAFKLFRGEPFKKMYDDWSDDKRLETLFSYETEVLSFAKKLISRGRTEEAEKLLRRAERIVPLMDE